MAMIFGGAPAVDPRTLAADLARRTPPVPCDRWLGRAGVFTLPLGREYGSGHLLLRGDALAALDATADHDLVLSGTDTSFVRTLSPITLLHAECVTPGAGTDPAAVYLCKVVDRRYHLKRVPSDWAYNVRTPDGQSYLSATVVSGVAWTWQEIVNDLSTILGIAPPTLPFTPDGTPESFVFYAPYSAWDALCDVLDRIACAVKYDPEGDSFAIVRLGTADPAAAGAAEELQRDRTWDGYSTEAVRAWRPQKVRVVFDRLPLPTDGSSPVYTVDVTLAVTPGAPAGTYVQLQDDEVAQGATGPAANAAALASRASERAADWVRKRSLYERPLLRVYRDFQAAGDFLGSTVGRAAYDDRGLMGTALRAEPDGILEGWRVRAGPQFPWGVDPTKPPPTGCTGCGWVAPLRAITDGIAVSLDGVDTGLVLLSTDGALWTSAAHIFICGTAYQLTFTKGDVSGPALVLLVESGSGSGIATRAGVRNCCGCAYAEFWFDKYTLCPGEAAPCGPCANVVAIRCAWVYAGTPGWAGAGWYCVRPCGTLGTGTVVDLLAPDPTLEILSGPWNTQAAALAHCGTVAGVGCGTPSGQVPYQLGYKVTTGDPAGGISPCTPACDQTFDVILTKVPGLCHWSGGAGVACGDGSFFSLAGIFAIQFVGPGNWLYSLSIATGGLGYTLTLATPWDGTTPLTLALTSSTGPTPCGFGSTNNTTITIYPGNAP